MSDKKIKENELLNKIANGMGVKISTWENVNETIKEDISFGIIVNSCSYMSKEDMKNIRIKKQV